VTKALHPVFRRHDFFAPPAPGRNDAGRPEIIWQARRPGEQDWSDECRSLAFVLNGSVPEREDDDFFVMVNSHRDREVHFEVPAPPQPHQDRDWRRIIDTAAEPPADFVDPGTAETVGPGRTVAVLPMGCVVLQSMPG